MLMWILYFAVIQATYANPAVNNETKAMVLTAPTPTPIVLWHGMGDTSIAVYSLGMFKYFLEQEIPGVYVLSLRLGNDTIEDFESGFFMNPNKQVKYVCKILRKDPKLKNGFNVIGFSQGSQFVRAVVQRCGHILPPIKTMVSLGGQHQGIYGLPHCGTPPAQYKACDYFRKLLNYAAYDRWLQESLVQATYWHDPLNESLYRNGSIFLADINNENTINQIYIDNLNKLQYFVLVKFNNDTMVVPPESEWFGFYAPGRSDKIISLQETRLYKQDRLGLGKMDKAGKLKFFELPSDHLQFSRQWFSKEIIKPYLLN